MSAQMPPLSAQTEEALLPASAGTYALHLYLSDTQDIAHAHFGSITLTRGWYVYFGSAFGPGGIRARVSRHLRQNSKLHWHIDWLLPHAHIRGIWHNTSPIHYECAWCHIIARMSFASIPVVGFGSSDCKDSCKSHLVAIGQSPHALAITRALRTVSASTSTVRYLSLIASATQDLATSTHSL